MSEPTRKRPIDSKEIVELRCLIPKRNIQPAIYKYLERKGAIDISERPPIRTKEESIPWEEMDAIRQQFDKYSKSGVMLRGSRELEELSQHKLSKLTGIPQHHISEMENGKRPIGKKNAKKFAEVFDCDYRVFL